MTQRLKMVIGVHLILRRGSKVLLACRCGTGWGDGQYNLPCGHLDAGEKAVTGLAREAKEEIGITLRSGNLVFVGATHWQSTKQSINLFFECRKWSGVPVKGEPEKCDDISWFDLQKLPRNIVSQSAKVLRAYRRGNIPFFVEVLK